MVQRRSCKNSAFTQGWKYIVTSHGKELKMRIMESRVKSIIREEVGRAIRSRLLREADGDDTDPDYPYMPDAESNRKRDAYFARGESAAEKAAERAMAGVEEEEEGVDDYYGDDDPNRDDEALEIGLPYGPSGYDFSVVDAFKSMNPKPEGLIIDCSNMEGSGGGYYPAYMVMGGKIKYLQEDAGNIADAFVSYVSEMGSLPKGCYIAGANQDTGVFEITNSI
jgi:hypothetical protein